MPRLPRRLPNIVKIRPGENATGIPSARIPLE
jgi:hypothetical protein